ncbi:MAG TPA: hypothetical protein DCQ06_13270 [Myxococcales bacterium]|nr:hypothetical protein [Myxococcales bacterium]
MAINMDGIQKKIDKAGADVQKKVDESAQKLKETREKGEEQIDKAKESADKKIDNSKMPDPVKKAAKDAVAAGHKEAKKAVEKAKEEAKGAVEKAEEEAKKAVDDAEKEANKVIDDANAEVKKLVGAAKAELEKVTDKLPGPLKDAANQGLDKLEELANGGLDKLAAEGKDIVKNLGDKADDEIGKLKDKALEVLGFEPAEELPEVPGVPTPAEPKSNDTSRTFDHRGGFNFRVELGGIAAGAFTAVDGLTAEIETIEYAGGMDMFTRQIPGRPKVSPITLKKGYVNTAALWDWMKSTMEGTLQFENVSIVLLADDGKTELVRYDLQETWPSRWAGFQLDAQSNNAMLEELELQARTISRVAA